MSRRRKPGSRKSLVSRGDSSGAEMTLSREARLVAGVTLLTVPTIMYGGATLLGTLTKGAAGISPGNLALDQTQWALFRAGHAHAGVWVVLSLVIQVLLDSAALSRKLKWLARVAAPLAAGAPLGGCFFGVLCTRLTSLL